MLGMGQGLRASLKAIADTW